MLIAAYPSTLSPELSEALLLGGITVKPLDDLEGPMEQAGEWSMILVELGEDPLRRLRLLRNVVSDTGLPSLVVSAREHIALLDQESEVSDFILSPVDPVEMKIRINRLAADTVPDEILSYRDLVLNTGTYQAAVGGRPVDLTFMEYELLRYFVDNSGRVWSREQLLSKVWGYDYFGGARTVDVHVRRLRAKLGEERSSWITTVRSVGYRFG